MRAKQLKKQTYDPHNKKLSERAFHALTFELVATLICAPLFAFIMDKSILAMGALSLILATIAMFWNFAYNFLFDKISKKYQINKTFRIRLIHATLFELGLIFVSVPLAAWFLSLSLVAAFIMDIGILLFFLPYTVTFNWIYDILRKQLWVRRDSEELSH